jgi:hypothetical protein
MTICLLSSESLKIMYLYFLLSFRSLKAWTHSCETVALHGDCQYVSSSVVSKSARAAVAELRDKAVIAWIASERKE